MIKLSTLFALGCTLALGVEVAISIHSRSHCDALWKTRGASDRLNVTSEFGEVVIELESPQKAALRTTWVHFDIATPRLWNRHHTFGGFLYFHDIVRHYVLLPPTPTVGVALPHWLIALLLSIPPIRWVMRHRREVLRRLRIRLGHCIECGYNLTANQSGVCPECGSASAISIHRA